MMNRRAFLCGLTLGTLASSLAAEAQQTETSAEFDLVVRGGRVIDPESGIDRVRDIGIRDGRIEHIAERRLAVVRCSRRPGRLSRPASSICIPMRCNCWRRVCKPTMASRRRSSSRAAYSCSRIL